MSSERSLQPTRRELIALGIGAFVVAAIPAAARGRPRLVRRTLPVMGTIAEVVVVHPREDQAAEAIDAALGELRAVERTMSRFRPESDIGRANAGAAGAPVGVGAATAVVIARALDWARASDGAFDPAIGRVVELWDVTHRQEPPPGERVRALAHRQLFRAVEVAVGRGGPAVSFASPDVHLDLGGIAKGFAVDRAVDALRAHGVTGALVNAGGDLYALGTRPDGAPWHVGIRSPADPSALSGTLEVTDAAVATSGDYEQFFRWRGVRYHHLMDPGTAAPRHTAIHSVTVRAAHCVDADAGATAAFTLGTGKAAAVLASCGATLVSTG